MSTEPATGRRNVVALAPIVLALVALAWLVPPVAAGSTPERLFREGMGLHEYWERIERAGYRVQHVDYDGATTVRFHLEGAESAVVEVRIAVDHTVHRVSIRDRTEIFPGNSDQVNDSRRRLALAGALQ